jgi:GNAT superfamily N-acetyltransferase
MGRFGPRVMPCPVEVRGAALEVLYRRVPAALRDRLIVEVLNEERRGELDLSGLWVAQGRGGRITGSLLTHPLAGRAAGVWAPEVRPSWCRAALAAALVQAALANLQDRGFCVAQAVLDESAGPRASRDLIRGGMPRVTELLYLERDTAKPLLPALGLSVKRDQTCSRFGLDLEWRPYEAAVEAEFRAALQSTYKGSLDMPELEGTRSLDDILEGHRGAGRFCAERWQLGRIPGNPRAAAVLLLAEVPSRDAWEIVYLGLTPEARGCGLGSATLRYALDLARPYVSRLELAVDLRNTPATQLYRSAGFVIRDRRSVHLAILSKANLHRDDVGPQEC